MMSPRSFLSTCGQHHWSPELIWDPPAAHTLPAADLEPPSVHDGPCLSEPSGETPAPADTLSAACAGQVEPHSGSWLTEAMRWQRCIKLPSLGSLLPRNREQYSIIWKLSFPHMSYTLYSFSKIVLTKFHKLDGFKQQKCILSQFWGLEVWDQCVSRARISLKYVRKSFFPSACLLAVAAKLSVLWLEAALPSLGFRCRVAFSLCVSAFTWESSYKDPDHTGLEPTLLLDDLTSS